jgi:hypothetical protein
MEYQRLATSGSALVGGEVGAATQAAMSVKKRAGALKSIIVGAAEQVKTI